MKGTVVEQMDTLSARAIEVIPEEELARKIEASINEKRPLQIKQGFDPSAPDLHIGHAVSLRKLREFQEFGHQVIFLIGDFTGMIGDPSGVSQTRKLLTREQVEENARSYQEQFSKILDPDRTTVRFNSEWCSPMTFANVIELTSKYTVARILERDDFTGRFKEGKPISILELLYPLIQGYDSVALEADVELGGTDQKFNLMVAREIQRAYGQKPEVALIMPILEGTSGDGQKMSKSLGNYIGISEAPADMYGKTMSIPDELIVPYFELATDVSKDELAEISDALDDGKMNPMDLKKRLAARLVSIYHSDDEAKSAGDEFARVFSSRELPSDIPEPAKHSRTQPQRLKRCSCKVSRQLPTARHLPTEENAG